MFNSPKKKFDEDRKVFSFTIWTYKETLTDAPS